MREKTRGLRVCFRVVVLFVSVFIGEAAVAAKSVHAVAASRCVRSEIAQPQSGSRFAVVRGRVVGAARA